MNLTYKVTNKSRHFSLFCVICAFLDAPGCVAGYGECHAVTTISFLFHPLECKFQPMESKFHSLEYTSCLLKW